MRRGVMLLLTGMLCSSCAWATASAVFVLNIHGVIGPATPIQIGGMPFEAGNY